MLRHLIVFAVLVIGASQSVAQSPSYSKDIRPFLAKYCVECHNAKTLKGTLDLETYKAMMDGSDAGAVVKASKPDESKLVLLAEHKGKPTMPPPKAKFQPTKDEVKLLRAWVLAGAKDDAVLVKVELPAIKAKVDGLAPVTALAENGGVLFAARGNGHFSRLTPGAPWVNAEVFKNGVSAMRPCPVDENVAVATGRAGMPGKVVLLWTGPKRMSVTALPIEHADAILDVAFNPTGRILATCGYDTVIRLSDISIFQANPKPDGGPNPLKNVKVLHTLKEHSDAVYGLAFNPDGTLLASVSADRAMKIWDVEKGKLLYTLGEGTDWLYTVAWSPDGKYLVSGGVDKSIRVYEANPVGQAFQPDDPRSQAGKPDLRWRTGAKLRQSVFAHEGPVQKVLFSSDSKTLYSVGQDRVIKAWDVEKMVERKVYDKQPETVLCMALREDAGQIIIGRYDGIVQLIDMKTGKVVHEFGAKKEEKGRQGDKEKGRQGEGEYETSSPQASAASLRGQPAPPTLFKGTLDRAGAVHIQRIDAKPGQALAVQLTKDAKSKFEPVLTLTDSSGRILAESYDGHLGHTFTAGGAHAISVRDREFRGGADFTFQLKLGEFPVLTEVFPMGVQCGTTADIQLSGVYLPKKTVSITIPKDAKLGDRIPLPVGKDVLGKAEIVVGEWSEIAKGTLPVPGTANGQLARDNQNAVWTFAAKKGQPLVVEVNARRLGSRLDSIIEILDKNDQPVPRAVLRSQAKTHVTFRDHDSAQGNIRIEAWSELGVNDYLYVGTELMKIQSLPTHPDADCNFFATQGQRIGYLDTTPTHHANNTPMYKVNVHPPGMTFPPNGYPVFTLFYRNDDGGFGFGRDSRILFDPPADGEYKVRIADARGMGGVNFGYRLTVRPPRPSFNVRFAPAAPAVSNYNAIPFTISVDRFDGFDGPIAIRFENLPPGFSAPATTIEAGTFSTTVALHASVLAPSAPSKLLMKVIGEAIIDGKKQTHEAIVPQPKLIEEGDIRTWTDESEVTLKAGQQAKLIVHIERKAGFTGRVPLDVKGLPHGVRVLDIGLNGILVNENETTRTVVLYAEPWVQAQEHPFVVLARHEGKKTEHAAKSVLLKVK